MTPDIGCDTADFRCSTNSAIPSLGESELASKGPECKPYVASAEGKPRFAPAAKSLIANRMGKGSAVRANAEPRRTFAMQIEH